MTAEALSHMSLAGFFTLVALFGCSVVMAALAWELKRRHSTSTLDGDWLLAQILHMLGEGQSSTEDVRSYLNQISRPVAELCVQVLSLKEPSLERGDYLISAELERQSGELERGLSHLGTIAVIAPFVGLFGTVVGITKTFGDVAKMGKAGIEVVSAGVSEALIATAIGLLVAILSVILFNWLRKLFDSEIKNRDLCARSLLNVLLNPDASLFEERVKSQDTSSAESFLKELKS